MVFESNCTTTTRSTAEGVKYFVEPAGGSLRRAKSRRHHRREGVEISARKEQLVSILTDVATLGSERMAEEIGKASLRDAAIGTGIAVDKMLALTGQMPAVQIANLVMPTEEEREARRATDRRLDEIARRLRDAHASAE